MSKSDKRITIITYDKAILTAWEEHMKYVVPPVGIPLNALLDIFPVIGGTAWRELLSIPMYFSNGMSMSKLQLWA